MLMMVCDTLMSDCVMLKILFLTPTINCSTLTIDYVISMEVCDILTIICVMFSVQNKVYAVGYSYN